MSNVMGKAKKEEYNPKLAKEMAVEIEKKRHPLKSRRRIERQVEKAAKQVEKKNGIKM